MPREGSFIPYDNTMTVARFGVGLWAPHEGPGRGWPVSGTISLGRHRMDRSLRVWLMQAQCKAGVDREGEVRGERPRCEGEHVHFQQRALYAPRMTCYSTYFLFSHPILRA